MASARHQIGRLDSEAISKPHKLVEARIGFSALDARQIASGHVDLVGQCLLADTRCLAQFTKPPPKGDAVFGLRRT